MNQTRCIGRKVGLIYLMMPWNHSCWQVKYGVFSPISFPLFPIPFAPPLWTLKGGTKKFGELADSRVSHLLECGTQTRFVPIYLLQWLKAFGCVGWECIFSLKTVFLSSDTYTLLLMSLLNWAFSPTVQEFPWTSGWILQFSHLIYSIHFP